MKIALAQINPIVGDFVGNLRQIEGALEKAIEKRADLCVFPEMAITGYPPQDLLERSRFVGDNLTCLEQLAKKTKDIAAIVGYVRPSQRAGGRQLENTAALISDGEIVSTHAKVLLPTYNVFDEVRYFEPAEVVRAVDFLGVRLGILICEDICGSSGMWAERHHGRDPSAELVKQGAEVLIAIAATPFIYEKREERLQMITEVARRHSRPVIFVNQVGGNDSLVFDGHSLVLDSGGEIIACAGEFTEDFVCVDMESETGDIHGVCPNREAAVIEALSLGTRDFALKNGYSSLVLGLSGELDSSVVASVAARALGSENVYGVSLPSRDSAADSRAAAAALAEKLGINYFALEIDELFRFFADKLEPLFGDQGFNTTEMGFRSGIREVLLRALSNRYGCLLLSTADRTEMATGNTSIYGDITGGLSVLGDIPKTLVFRLAEEINREDEIISNTILETEAPVGSGPPCSILDPILERLLTQELSAETVISEGFEEAVVLEISRQVHANQYRRRQAPPCLKVTSRVLGFERRMPIAQHWEE